MGASAIICDEPARGHGEERAAGGCALCVGAEAAQVAFEVEPFGGAEAEDFGVEPGGPGGDPAEAAAGEVFQVLVLGEARFERCAGIRLT